MEESSRFGTFAGVYRPIVLTILGAMLYLREGWLVGSTGLGGALLVIGAAYVITGTTAMSVSSIATNVRVQPGGAFAIIAQALGLEAGGAIGLPLFVAQAASAVMYLYAFSEGWAYLFPEHPPMGVVAVAFAVVSVVVVLSSALAARAQAVMLFVVGIALVSALSGLVFADLVAPTWTAPQGQVTLREAFAIFFPAATGIMVGAGMSGSLAEPRTAIPRGTMAAWVTTGIVYVGAAFWYASIAPPEVLVANKTVMIEQAAVPQLVLLGLLSSTLMAALSTLVVAPKLLAAMAEQRVVPGGAWLAASSGGEPRRATAVTLLLGAAFMSTGSLDAIAPIVTSAYVVTYLAINLVVFVEQRLAMISFRPTFAIPRWVPALGVVACSVGLLASGPVTGVAALFLVVMIYAWLQRRHLDTPWETVRSGVAVSVAAWAARGVAHLERSERAWKPDCVVPLGSPEEAEAQIPLLTALTKTHGSVKLVAVHKEVERMEPAMAALAKVGARLNLAGIYATWTTVQAPDVATGTQLSIDALRGAFFPPNLVVLDASARTEAELQSALDRCRLHQLGLVIWLPHPKGGLGPAGDVAVWLSDRSPDWDLDLHMANLDLPVLIAYLLTQARGGAVQLHTVVRDESQAGPAMVWLDQLMSMGRLPRGTKRGVHAGSFLDAVRGTQGCCVQVFGLGEVVQRERLEAIRDAAGGACLFLMDSGQESVLA